jgi:hypothetical protein
LLNASTDQLIPSKFQLASGSDTVSEPEVLASMRSRRTIQRGVLHIRYPSQAGKRAQKIMDTANQFLPTEETLVKALMRAKSTSSLERVGIYVSRYGLTPE